MPPPDPAVSRELQRLQSADAAVDLQAAWDRADRRFIGVNGVAGSMAVGIDMTHGNLRLMQSNGASTIKGTADFITSDEQAQLQDLATRYATRYNQLLLGKLRAAAGEQAHS